MATDIEKQHALINMIDSLECLKSLKEIILDNGSDLTDDNIDNLKVINKLLRKAAQWD